METKDVSNALKVYVFSPFTRAGLGTERRWFCSLVMKQMGAES